MKSGRDNFRLSEPTNLRSSNSVSEFRINLGSILRSGDDLGDHLATSDGSSIATDDVSLVESFSEHFNSESRSGVNIEDFGVFPNSVLLISLLVSMRSCR